MHHGREVSAFATVRAQNDMPILHQLVTRQEQAFTQIEGHIDSLMRKIDELGAPDMPAPPHPVSAAQAPGTTGALLSVESISARAEVAAVRLELAMRRLSAAV